MNRSRCVRNIKSCYFLALLILLFSANLAAEGRGEYFPAAVGDVWYYEAYKRGEDSKVYHSLTRVEKTEIVDGKEYFYFHQRQQIEK